ncbi:MAG: hypothetical protein JNL21_28575 [Myxococcales bacterium]|nr:hypothetical protein [Myxococcales bacterium]
MGRDLEIECTCGAVHGRARDVSPDSVNRVVCLCADCQTFARHLGRADLLDPNGGSDIIQLAPNAVSFDRGTDKIAAIRLGPKGPFRWYSTCCNTPLGNTTKPSLPFVGIVYEAFRDARDPARRDEVFGPPRASIWGQNAVGEPPPGSTKMNVPFLLRTIRMIFGWKLGGRAWPHPFFDRSSEPLYPVRVLTREERASARPAHRAAG